MKPTNIRQLEQKLNALRVLEIKLELALAIQKDFIHSIQEAKNRNLDLRTFIASLPPTAYL